MNRDRVYLTHIVDAINRIETYTSVGKAEFMAATHWQDATIRQLEIIGEATKQLSAQVRDNNPDIPWRQIAGLRDVLIHNYMGVDLQAVWVITQQNLPSLKERIPAILNSLA